tara:strand:+ start:29 stop:217 length:189 start_codon:yes stop_codon:yes gene_type:complete
MEKLIKEVLDRYNTNRKKISNEELARLIVAHIRVGVDGKKGWYLNLNENKQDYARELIEEYS